MMSFVALINPAALRTTRGMKSSMQAMVAAAVLLAGCDLGETKLGTFEEDVENTAGTSDPVGELCESGDFRFGSVLSSELLEMNYDAQMACTVESIWVEGDAPQGAAELIHRTLNIDMQCEGEGEAGEVTLSLVAPKGEMFPFEVGQALLVDGERTFAPVGSRLTAFSVSATDGEVLLSYVEQTSVVFPEDAPGGVSCQDVFGDRIEELTDWLEPLDADLRDSSCRDDGLSVQIPDGQLGPAQGTDAPGDHRLFVDEVSCSTDDVGKHELNVTVGYWRTV